MNADTNYSFNPWMNPERPGDGVDPSVFLAPEQVIFEVANQVPMPAPAGYTPRLLGYERTEYGVTDVLNVGPSTLLRVTDAGQQGTLRPSMGA